MKYAILSSCGLELFLIPRLCAVKEVEKVYFWHMDSHYKSAGKDMENCPGWEKFQLITDWPQVLRESNKEELVIVIGDVGLGETGDYLRKMGYKVIGGSRFGDKAEDDRDYASQFMSKFMKIPPTASFESFEQGVGFLKTQDKEARFVFKPNDSGVPKEYTYVSKDIKDMLSFIKDVKPQWKWLESFQLQTVIDGTECDFNAYFNGKQFIDSTFLAYFEEKGIMDKNVGAATGGAVATAFRPKAEGKLWDILKKIELYLEKIDYRGQLAVNSIIDKQGDAYFLEFCVRFGYPSLPIEVTLLEDNGKSIHDLFMAMANGENPKDLFPMNKIGATISIFVPPAPNGEPEMMSGTKGQPISWDKKWDSYFFPYYIQWDEKKGMVLAGVCSWVLQCTCVDSTLPGAASMIYDEYMKTLRLKMAMYRSDVGEFSKERIKKLRGLKMI